MQFDDVNIGGQLKVGTGVCPAIKEGASKINGSTSLPTHTFCKRNKKRGRTNLNPSKKDEKSIRMAGETNLGTKSGLRRRETIAERV